MVGALGLAIAALLPVFCPAETIVVHPGPNAIQVAIDNARDGDEIVVSEGIYEEYIAFKGKNITLRSTDPTSATVVESTIIQGYDPGSPSSTGPLVRFLGTEGTTCTLSGFTILTIWLHTSGGELIGGGIKGNGALATIQYNQIISRPGSWTPGYGVRQCRGLIARNLIDSNQGAGLYDCDGIIEYNVVRNNSTGLCYSDGVIQNNIIAGNYSGGSGAGLYQCGGTIVNNLIYGNVCPDYGAGLYKCNGVVANNAISGNQVYGTIPDPSHTYGHGGGLAYCRGTIVNNIIWGNIGIQTSTSQIYLCSALSYCCVQYMPDSWGDHNIGLDPLFMGVGAEDFRIKGNSPCINAGTVVSQVTTDYEGRPRPLGGGYDIGAFEVPPSSVPTIVWGRYK
jgi:hypothetical protein